MPPRTHGESHPKTPEYNIWACMIQRCINPNVASYAGYGAKGIKVCRRWRLSFQDFLADVGRRPGPEYSLDRWPDRNGDYKPGNVRWATDIEQNNNSAHCRYYVFREEILSVSEIARRCGMKRECLKQRLEDGMTIEQATAVSHSLRRRLITANNQTLTLKEWSERTGLSMGCIRRRLLRGAAPETALSLPSQGKPYAEGRGGKRIAIGGTDRRFKS